MNIAVQPPDYFPGLSYLALMARVDRFVIADTYQYSRQSFHNRAHIRKPDGAQWLSVPLVGGQSGKRICDTLIETGRQWRRQHRRTLHYNYRSSPFYPFFEPVLEHFFAADFEKLGDLTSASIALLHELIELSTEIVRASDLSGQPGTLSSIIELIRPRKVIVFPSHSAAQAPNVEYETHGFAEPTYRQNFPGFVPGLSGLDALFNYGPEAITLLKSPRGAFRGN